MGDSVANDVSTGALGIARFFRAKTTLDGCLKPFPDATGDPPASKADCELALKIMGSVGVTPNDDGTYNVSIPHAEFKASFLNAFITNFKEKASSSSRTAYKAIDSTEYGGSSGIGTTIPVLGIIPVGLNSAGDKTVYLVSYFKVLSTTGGFTVDADNTKEMTFDLQTVKAKGDFIFHDADGVTLLDSTYVDTASESSDLTLTDGQETLFYEVEAA